MKKLLVCLVALCLCLGVCVALAEEVEPHTHELAWKIDKDPTCTEEGIKHQYCTMEGCTYEEEPVKIEKIDHVAGEPDTEDQPKDPTCTEKGHTLLVHCKNCGALIDGEYIDALGHDYQKVEAKEATCTEKGWNEHKACSRCGAIDPDHPKTEIDKLPHKPVPAEEFTAPDCTATEPLSVKAKCEVCGEELKEKIVIPIGDHKWKEVKGKDPTCTEPGYQAYKECEVCGKKAPDPEKEGKIDPLGHDFSEYKEALAGDCTHDGRMAGLYCSRCGEAKDPSMNLPAPGHKEEKIPAVAPTCTEKGKTEGKKCSVCGEILEEPKDVDALGHDWKTVLGTKATCTEAGVGAHRVCTRCNEIEWADPNKKVIPAHGHSDVKGFWPETKEYQDQGIAGDARTETWTVITDAEQQKVKDPTCTEDGYKAAEICGFCGEVLVPGKVLKALGHDWELKTPGTLPTCTEPGVSDLWECTRCGETKGGETINPRGHALTEVPEELPTCTKDGHFAYKKCTREGCDYAEAKAGIKMIEPKLPKEIQVVKTLEGEPNEDGNIEAKMPEKGHPAAFVVAAYDHKYTEEVRPVEPTCTEAGIADGATRCIICGEYFNLKALKALGHELVKVAAKEATCLDDGLKAYVYCSRCGKAVEAAEKTTDEQYQALLTASSIIKPEDDDPEEMIIAALGHKEAPGEAKEPTCTEAGRTAGKFCERCGITIEEQKEIKALGHDFHETEAKVEPTCTKPGKEAVQTCSRCKEKKGGEEIAALGHDAGAPTEPKEATCTEYGFTAGAHCTRCEVDYEPVLDYLLGNKIISGAELYEAGWLKVPELVEPLGHDLKAYADKAATCEGVGYDGYKECQRKGCDYTEGKILAALGHDWIKVPGGEKTAPTCVKAGTDGLQQCERCGKTEAIVVAALGHDLKVYEDKEPTCVDIGYKGYKECQREGCEYTEGEILKATGVHTWKHIDAVTPTCSKAGYTEGQECEVCGEVVRTELAADPEGWHHSLTEQILDEDEKLIETKVAELVEKGLLVDEKTGDATKPGSGMRTIKCAACGYPLYVELYPPVMKGDVNMDGKVNPTDALLVLQYYAGVIDSVPNPVAADFNEDGAIKPSDALGILQYYAAN